jgi:hypothetical protein
VWCELDDARGHRGVEYGTYFEQRQRNKRDRENKKDVNGRRLDPGPEGPKEL